MAKKVEITFSATAAKFHQVADGVASKMTHLSGVAELLKGQLLTALGGATLGAIVEHMANFAKNIEDASKRLNITVGQVYELKKASHQAGMEFDQWFTIFRKTEDFLQKVALSESGPLMAAQFMGITQAGAQHMTAREALIQMLGSNANRQTLEQVLGPKNVDIVLANKQQFLEHLKAPGSEISEEAVRRMADFKDKLIELTEEIEVRLLPAISDLVGWLLKFRAGTKDLGETWQKQEDEGIKLFFEKHGINAKEMSDRVEKAHTFTTRNMFLGPMGLGLKTSDIEKKRLEIMFPNEPDIVNKLLSMPRVNENINAILHPRKKPEIPPDRFGGGILEGGTNPFLNIGGLAGINTSMSAMRLFERTADATEGILNYLVTNAGPTIHSMYGSPIVGTTSAPSIFDISSYSKTLK